MAVLLCGFYGGYAMATMQTQQQLVALEVFTWQATGYYEVPPVVVEGQIQVMWSPNNENVTNIYFYDLHTGNCPRGGTYIGFYSTSNAIGHIVIKNTGTSVVNVTISSDLPESEGTISWFYVSTNEVFPYMILEPGETSDTIEIQLTVPMTATDGSHTFQIYIEATPV